MKAVVEVNNVPDYAYQKQFWVVSVVDREMWFYGAFDNEKECEDCMNHANRDDQIIVRNNRC